MEKKTLQGVLGSAGAAAALIGMIALFESGREVEVSFNDRGEATVKHLRGRQYLKAYLDVVGVATICDGLTHDENGRRVKMGDKKSEAQCAVMLERALISYSEKVIECTPNLYGRAQAAPAVSLAYNIGWPRYCTSTVDKKFDQGRWREGCDAFLMWRNAGGRPILLRRRQLERTECLKGL